MCTAIKPHSVDKKIIVEIVNLIKNFIRSTERD